MSPQQSPPSHSHPQLLFSSSHQLSPFQWGEPQLPAHAGVVVVVCCAGSRHSHALQYVVFTSSPQQSPPSHSHPQLLFSSSHQLSPFHWGEPHVPGQFDGGEGVVVDGAEVVVVDSPPQTFPISAINETCCKTLYIYRWGVSNEIILATLIAINKRLHLPSMHHWFCTCK